MINPIQYYKRQKLLLSFNPLRAYILKKRIRLLISLFTTILISFMVSYLSVYYLYKSNTNGLPKNLYKFHLTKSK